jgi:hypothetical protein
MKEFRVDDVFTVVRSQGRSLEVAEERLWQMGYGSDTIYLLFNLWYRDYNFVPAYGNNLPQVDHIFPQSVLNKVKLLNPQTGRMDLVKYRASTRDQLANCMLLSKEENGAGGKGDKLPDEWFTGRDSAYLDQHLIPDDPALWKLERFEDFIVARRKLIRDRFKALLVPSETP